VKVSWAQRLGRVGEKEIESRLSYFSKTSRDEVDIGIDFQCELLEDDSPTLPFFVQAKGTEHFDDGWSGGIKKSTLLYWLLKNYPVFIIVYDDKSENCYWMSVEDQRYHLLQKISEKETKTVQVKLDKSHILERGKNRNQEFIQKVKDDLHSIRLFFGRPEPKGEGYVKKMPDPPRSVSEHVLIKENVRMGLYSLIQHYLQKSDRKNAHLCCHFLSEFDKSHYNHFVWLGQINRSIGNYKEATSNFTEALRICQGDKKWPEDSMKRIIEFIKGEMEITDNIAKRIN